MSKQPIFLRQDGMLKRIDPDEIILLQVDDNYVKFHKAESFLMVRTSLNAALAALPANHFLKTHRTYAVSVHHIIEIARDHLILAGILDPIPISRQYYPELMKRLTIIGTGCSDKNDGT
jgi:DNA-binding LytR/AlgR family response regulator